MLYNRPIFGSEHELFRDNVRRFLETEFEPHIDHWERSGTISRDFWLSLGSQGFLCCDVDESYGGAGADVMYAVVIYEEIGYAIGGASLGVSTHAGIVAPYISHYGTQEQKGRILPGMVTGETIGAIGMTEPGAGSDLKAIRTTAIRRGDHYLVNGQKTFISNGQNADFLLLACKTDPDAGPGGISLLIVETNRKGFQRGKNLEKIGQKAADTSELFFTDVKVPLTNLLGHEGEGFQMMKKELARERMGIACRCFAAAVRAYALTLDYVNERSAFGNKLIEFQNTRFQFADMKTELLVGRAFLDECLEKLRNGDLGADQAAMAKLWITELEGRITDRCLQLFGGYGYMSEYPISKFFVNARATRLYGGTSEIMREIISRNL